MSAEDTLKLISKQWCSIIYLMKLLGCGRNKVLEVKKDIKKLINEDYYIQGNNLPIKAVINVLKMI